MIQVVFLVDTKISDVLFFERHYRSLCLACTRILLFLSEFPNKEYLSKLQWNYKLFSSTVTLQSVRASTSQFYETRSEFIEKFFSELSVNLKEKKSESLLTQQKHCWSRSRYNALAATVEDFIWDAPEIKTPKSTRRQRRRSKGNTAEPSSSRNIIILFTETPSGKISHGNLVSLVNKMLPKALLTQFHHKKISLYWVYSGSVASGMLETLNRALGSTGGNLVPMSCFLDPIPERSGSGLFSLLPLRKVRLMTFQGV